MSKKRRRLTLVPVTTAVGLILAACGLGEDSGAVAQQPPAAVAEAAVGPSDAAPDAPDTRSAAPAADRTAPAIARTMPAPEAGVVKSTVAARPGKKAVTGPRAGPVVKRAASPPTIAAPRNEPAADEQAYARTDGATDVGVTKTSIKLGSINMHSMPMGNFITVPVVRGNLAVATSVNDRGGILGRRLSIVDCDDATGETARAKACIKKFVGQDKIFSLVTGVDWATASIHEDLKINKLPYVGAWAYSQTEWQDPYMFPTHMSMIHEARAGAGWVRNVIKPKTYGLLCLTSPEMQLACDQVQQVLDPWGARLVKRVDVGITENTMSAAIIAMRAANPDHIVHYVINPVTIGKFMIEAAQQGYYPPLGISGNHMMAELIGSVWGKFPVNRYWTNTTYKIWGPEFIAMMNKYARGNKGNNHHIVQAGYVGMNLFAQAALQVGPNLTRERLIATLSNGKVWRSDASLDQKFSYLPAERYGENWNPNYGQGREFMYKYTDPDTTANPDGSPSGWIPDPDQFVIHAQ